MAFALASRCLPFKKYESLMVTRYTWIPRDFRYIDILTFQVWKLRISNMRGAMKSICVYKQILWLVKRGSLTLGC